ncbi:MAG TPA: hypothetical protein VIV12_01750, partial [Streptosporangiaceae bacterium]
EGSLTESSALSVKTGQPHCENTRSHKSQKSCTERLTQRGIVMHGFTGVVADDAYGADQDDMGVYHRLDRLENDHPRDRGQLVIA